MSLLSIGAIALSAVVIGSVALPVLADHWEPEGGEAQKLAAATKATARKAGDLGTSFARAAPVHAAAGPQDSAGDDPQPGSSTTRQLDRDRDHAVAVALRELAALDAETDGPGVDERVIAIENLRAVWTPRYQQAEQELRRLSYRIEHADRAAKRYFQTQAISGQFM